ncbi:hypothetical protein ABIC55_000082 [Sporosarcina psychrophila]|uniref:Uncharacterized protein n=1 Tax=Sporosarcina psychrophila TaxID=1476 RepID=A0ABV2K4M6_SPOPS
MNEKTDTFSGGMKQLLLRRRLSINQNCTPITLYEWGTVFYCFLSPEPRNFSSLDELLLES